jgi:hypothetical protein
MERMIRGAGREPFERDAFYERVVRDEKGRVLRANRHDFTGDHERDASKGKRENEKERPAPHAGTLDAAIASS